MRIVRRYWAVLALAVLLLGAFVGIGGDAGPKNDFRFSILGDRTGGAAPEVYGRIWREIDLLHPDFVINVGDTIQGHDDAGAESEWQAVVSVWRRYAEYPLYSTPGNHDIWNDASRALYEKVTGRRSYYGFNWQDAHFTVLDNSITTELSDQQLQFLEKDLAANRTRRPKFVFFHKPYWIVPLKLGSGDFRLHQLAKKYGVDCVISGHGHQFLRMVRDGIVYMEVGSSGARVPVDAGKGEGLAQGRFYEHVWARVKGPKVQITVKELDGPMGKGRMFRAEDWKDNGPAFDPADPAAKDKPET
jgi:calcineurin-like phosphoesterase family protein